jgi:two-component system cell cycle response regulator DivK
MVDTILLVEDNATNQYLATFILEQAGYRVVAARNGRAALEIARNAPPTVVVMDIQMPEMDGYETAAAMRLDPALAHIPLLAMTSFAMSGDRERARTAGFTAYLEKPIDPDGFLLQVAALTGR